MKFSAMVVAMIAILAGGAPSAHAGAYNCFGEDATLVGTPGDDILIGTDGPDVIVGLEGSDLIFGGDGPDLICGGEGDDGSYLPSSGVGGLSGGLGVDKISGGPGNDEVNGGRDSLLDSDSGSGDFLYGKEGDDHLCDNACAQNSYQMIDSGDDRIEGGSGNDILSSTGGDDQQLGGRGNDRLGRQLFVCDATSCEEVITVDTGADTYLGGIGDDSITASDDTEGNDVVNGGDDIDTCSADAQDIIVKCE